MFFSHFSCIVISWKYIYTFVNVFVVYIVLIKFGPKFCVRLFNLAFNLKESLFLKSLNHRKSIPIATEISCSFVITKISNNNLNY